MTLSKFNASGWHINIFCFLFYKFHVEMILMHHENALSYYLKESQFNGNHSLFKASHISELKLCGTFSQAKLSQSLLMLQRSSPGLHHHDELSKTQSGLGSFASSWSEFRMVWSKDSPLLSVVSTPWHLQILAPEVRLQIESVMMRQLICLLSAQPLPSPAQASQ